MSNHPPDNPTAETAAPPLADRTCIVLVAPQDAANVGAVLRVMLNFGLRHLRLVNPAPAALDPARLDDLAHRSGQLAHAAQVFPTLAQALAGASFVAGASARRREQAVARAPRDAAPDLLAHARRGRLALVFGPESNGLTNADLDLCHVQLTVPTSPAYRSLNLAQAALIVCYELWLAAAEATPVAASPSPAAVTQTEAMFAAWQQALTATGFLKAGQEIAIMRRWRRLIQRAVPSPTETALLHAIARQAVTAAQRP